MSKPTAGCTLSISVGVNQRGEDISREVGTIQTWQGVALAEPHKLTLMEFIDKGGWIYHSRKTGENLFWLNSRAVEHLHLTHELLKSLLEDGTLAVESVMAAGIRKLPGPVTFYRSPKWLKPTQPYPPRTGNQQEQSNGN